MYWIDVKALHRKMQYFNLGVIMLPCLHKNRCMSFALKCNHVTTFHLVSDDWRIIRLLTCMKIKSGLLLCIGRIHSSRIEMYFSLEKLPIKKRILQGPSCSIEAQIPTFSNIISLENITLLQSVLRLANAKFNLFVCATVSVTVF